MEMELKGEKILSDAIKRIRKDNDEYFARTIDPIIERGKRQAPIDLFSERRSKIK
jgi:hypothetical protein